MRTIFSGSGTMWVQFSLFPTYSHRCNSINLLLREKRVKRKGGKSRDFVIREKRGNESEFDKLFIFVTFSFTSLRLDDSSRKVFCFCASLSLNGNLASET